MTISSSTRIAGPFTGNGVSTSFPFAFKVFSSSDMYVVRLDSSTGVETVLVLNSDYTVTLNGDQNASPGGTVALPAALAVGYTLTITSNVPFTQATDLTNQGGFYPSVINNALDKLTILAQQLNQESGRQIVAPISDGAVDMELPAAGERASQYLAFDAAGLPIVAQPSGAGVPVTAFMQTLLDDSDAATARVTLGGLATLAGSETLANKTISSPAITGAATIVANTSTDALRITQTGAGNALVVEDSSNPDATPFVVDGAGNVGVGQAPGTSGTTGKLEVATTNGVATKLLLSQTGITNYSWTIPASTDAFALIYGASTERLRVNAAGAISTGGASPATGYAAAGDLTLPSTSKVRAVNTLKAWVTFPATGVIQDSFNVSSVTKNSTGDYTIAFTNAFANGTYIMLAMPGGQRLVTNRSVTQYDNKSTSGIRVLYVDASGAAGDPQDTGLAFIGA